jgi:uncharacterized protein
MPTHPTQTRRRANRIVAIVVFLTLVGISESCSMIDSHAAEFFEGQRLEAARAIANGNMEQLRAATRGLDVDKYGRKEMTLLWFAISEKNFDAIRFLVQLGSNPGANGAQGLGFPVDYALKNKDTRFFKAMLDGGMPVDLSTKWKTTLLHKAAGEYGASLEHVKMLVERGAQLDIQDEAGSPPLLFAIGTHQADRARYLVERGARLDLPTPRGVLPARAVQVVIEGQQPGSPMRRDFDALRDLMILHGAKFPPDTVEQVREWMKSQGMHVAE